MPAPINTLKARLARAETTVGLWLGTGEPYLAEMAAQCGFDWVLIDGEHGPNDIRSLSAQLGAVAGKGSAPVVRLADDNPATIKQALDIGAQTLLIPMVESVEQARRCLRATRYPPEGFRGVGASMARASDFGIVSDYLATANDQICVILQVESLAGLRALPDILEIAELDAVFIGPSDLAADMGYLGNPAHPKVREAVLKALGTIRDAGKAAGVMALDPAFIRETQAAGANFIGIAVDVISYVQTLRGIAREWTSGSAFD